MSQSEYEGVGQRESLLDVVFDKLQKAGKNTILTRLIYVAKFSKREGGLDHQKAFYNKIVDKYDTSGEVTGMLMVYPACMVHVLEAKTSTIMAILRETVAGVSDSHIAEARVISSTEDIPSRCYSGYYTSFVNTASTADSMDPVDATTIVKQASDLNTFMRKVGTSLTGQPDAEVRRKLMAMEIHFDDLPAPELILSLAPSEEAPTLDEFLDIFDAPVAVDLDSEQVWPMPTSFQF